MKSLATFDIETDPFLYGRFPEPFAVDFFDGKKHITIWGKDCVKKIVPILRAFDGYVYAHNGGKFDWLFLLPFFNGKEQIKLIDSRIAEIKTESAVLRDSFCILPVPLRSFDKTEIDYRKLERDVREKHKDEIIQYLKNDTESLFSAVRKFVDKYGIGLTLANRGLSQLVKTDYKKPKKVSEKFDKKFRPYYYGGRCQAFQTGKITGKFFAVDINSAYPAAMLERHWFGDSFIESNELPKNKSEIGPCFIELEADSLGAFPYREKGGALSFPRRRDIFRVTGWEVLAGIDTQTIKNVTILRVYKPLETKSMKDFVKKFAKQKLECEINGDRAGRLFAKLLMNSVYGKFAINPEHFRDYQITRLEDYPADGRKWELTQQFPDIGFQVWETPTPIRPGSFINVATAASITGAVRAFLWRSICAVEMPYYCDTDSIICRDTKNLEIGNDLGKWKIEAEGNDSLFIAGKKLYCYKDKSGSEKTVSKGVKLTYNEIAEIALGAVKTYNFDAPTMSLKTPPRWTTRKIRRTANV